MTITTLDSVKWRRLTELAMKHAWSPGQAPSDLYDQSRACRKLTFPDLSPGGQLLWGTLNRMSEAFALAPAAQRMRLADALAGWATECRRQLDGEPDDQAAQACLPFRRDIDG